MGFVVFESQCILCPWWGDVSFALSCVLRQLATWQLVCLILTWQILVSPISSGNTVYYIVFSANWCKSRIHPVILRFLAVWKEVSHSSHLQTCCPSQRVVLCLPRYNLKVLNDNWFEAGDSAKKVICSRFISKHIWYTKETHISCIYMHTYRIISYHIHV